MAARKRSALRCHRRIRHQPKHQFGVISGCKVHHARTVSNRHFTCQAQGFAKASPQRPCDIAAFEIALGQESLTHPAIST
jgi:hypothetical protein